MSRLGLSARLYCLLFPLAVVGVVVSFVAHRVLQTNATDLVDARLVKEMAMTSLANLYRQDDATKAILLEPENLEPGGRKIEAYDANVQLFERMGATTKSDVIRAKIRQLQAVDESKLRPVDTAWVDTVMGGDQGTELYPDG